MNNFTSRYHLNAESKSVASVSGPGICLIWHEGSDDATVYPSYGTAVVVEGLRNTVEGAPLSFEIVLEALS